MNTKCLFSETLSPKNHSRVSFDKKVYQDDVLVSLTETLTTITTANHVGEQIYSPLSIKRKHLPQNYDHFLVFLTIKFVVLE